MSNCPDMSTCSGIVDACVEVISKLLEVKPATISRKNVTAKANASGLAVPGDQRPFIMDVNGGEASLR